MIRPVAPLILALLALRLLAPPAVTVAVWLALILCANALLRSRAGLSRACTCACLLAPLLWQLPAPAALAITALLWLAPRLTPRRTGATVHSPHSRVIG